MQCITDGRRSAKIRYFCYVQNTNVMPNLDCMGPAALQEMEPPFSTDTPRA